MREELAVITVEKPGGGALENGGSDWPGWGPGLPGAPPSGGALPTRLVLGGPKKASNQNPYCRRGKDHRCVYPASTLAGTSRTKHALIAFCSASLFCIFWYSLKVELHFMYLIVLLLSLSRNA